ncbi:MAG TPA: GNAT family N-acetyltransferase [Nocardioidaceae bacterium]|nr:GNAT family N-acetyltransferase [Nocardioidaceae bacterium]
MSEVTIRPAVEADLPLLVRIEVEAGALFRTVGLDEVADHPVHEDDYRPALADERAWVAERDGEVAGYIYAEQVDENAHIEQVSVSPDHAGHGVGARLVRLVEAWGRNAGRPATTLTTFKDVPWNAPYYRRLGYREMAADEIGPELAATMAHEATLPGIRAEDRCAMVKPATQ